ncbi:MAG: leucine-rich repeat domain-containing protein [Bacteroidales bacterium]|nr:leucine-rich repeat domain-containing protein [Bacteroidales bacterium]
MKKLILLLFIATSTLLTNHAMAYDFLAECSTGQFLYYNITSDVEPYTVEVTYERGDGGYYIAPVGNIEIPSSVNYNGITYSVTNINGFAFYNCHDITSITIPNSVTNIGYYAFYGCKVLTSVAFGDSLENIDEYAFEGCSNLTSIAIPNSVTSIGTFAFKNCRLLTEVTIGSSVTNIGGDAFDLCNSLTTVNYNAIHCTAAYSPFNRCSALSSIYIDENVTNIPASIFTQCRNLRIYFNGDIEQWCTMIFSEGNANIEWIDNGYDLYIGGDPVYDLVIPETITEINVHAFRCAKNITSLTIPSSVTSIGYYAFDGCSGLTTINFNATNCSYMGSSTEPVLAIFNGCTSLEYLNIGDNVTNIPDLAFYGCHGITSVAIPSSVINIGENAFFEVRNIAYSGNATGRPWGALTVNGFVDGHLVYYDDTQTVLTGCGALATEIIIPNSVTNIGENAFSECKATSSISIPGSVTSIGNNAFKNVRNIIYDGTATGSPWGALTMNGLTDGYLVYSDDTRTQITGCNTLADVITIPSSVTNINNGAFSGCNNLTSVNFNATNCNNANSVFGECEAFTILNIGDNVTKIPDGMFSYCMGLTSVIIPNSVDSIGTNAFSLCSSLLSIAIGNSVTSIGASAFFNCSSLYEITIPESVTYIGEGAFMECGSLTTVNFNAIDCNADNTLFPECTSLINIT